MAESSEEDFKEQDTLIDQQSEKGGGLCGRLMKTKSSRLSSMLGLIGLYFLAEIIVGHITGSLTLVADSFHMLSDGLSLIVALIAVRMSKRKANQSITTWPSKQEYFNTFGWVRFEVVGALINSTFLLALCVSIMMEAIEKFLEPTLVTQPYLILTVGGGGLLINVLGLLMFGGHAHGHDHGHSHGGHNHNHENSNHNHQSHDHSHGTHNHSNHSHLNHSGGHEYNKLGLASSMILNMEKVTQPSVKKVESEDQMNMRAVFLHILGDALGSVIVMISATVVLLVPHKVYHDGVNATAANVTGASVNYTYVTTHNHWILYMDPVMSVCLVLIMVSTTIPLFKKSSLILLQTVPKNIQLQCVKEKIETIEGVQEIHDFHVWQLAGEKYVATVHVQCCDSQTYLNVAKKIKESLHDEGIHSLTIQPEFTQSPSRHCSMVCESDSCKSKVCCEISSDPPKKNLRKTSSTNSDGGPEKPPPPKKPTFHISPSGNNISIFPDNEVDV